MNDASDNFSPGMNDEPILDGMYRSIESGVERVSLLKCRYPDQTSYWGIVNRQDWYDISQRVGRKHLQKSSLPSQGTNLMDANAPFRYVKFILE